MLHKIEKPDDRPVICTISGNAGLGKTSLAATFPKPIFIRVEDGLQSIPVSHRPDAFPILSSVDDLWDQLDALKDEPHEYKTLVIDSITQLDTMLQQYIVETDTKKPSSINQALGGYGAGYAALAGMHGCVRKYASQLNNKGMHVVFIAHSDTETVDLPDQDAFSIYSIRIHKKSISHYIDNVDIVGFIRLETFTTGEGDRKKAISDGSRVITCHAIASAVSKNRYGITEDLPLIRGKNPFMGIIPTLTGDKK